MNLATQKALQNAVDTVVVARVHCEADLKAARKAVADEEARLQRLEQELFELKAASEKLGIRLRTETVL